MKVIWFEEAWEDYVSWQTQDNITIKCVFLFTVGVYNTYTRGMSNEEITGSISIYNRKYRKSS